MSIPAPVIGASKHNFQYTYLGAEKDNEADGRTFQKNLVVILLLGYG